MISSSYHRRQSKGSEVVNDLSRAAFWQEFLLQKCYFPKPEALAEQFENAEFLDFCACGCNSFAVRIKPNANIVPLVSVGRYGLIFEADFHLVDEGKSLEILLFVDSTGHLEYVEIDCCANSFPIPDDIQVDGPPYHLFVHEELGE